MRSTDPRYHIPSVSSLYELSNLTSPRNVRLTARLKELEGGKRLFQLRPICRLLPCLAVTNNQEAVHHEIVIIRRYLSQVLVRLQASITMSSGGEPVSATEHAADTDIPMPDANLQDEV